MAGAPQLDHRVPAPVRAAHREPSALPDERQAVTELFHFGGRAVEPLLESLADLLEPVGAGVELVPLPAAPFADLRGHTL